MIVKFTNGWFAQYDGDGKWLMINRQDEVIRVGYLQPMIERYQLIRGEMIGVKS